MPRIDRTPLAKTDAAEIWYYIAQDNVTAADKIIEQFEERFQMLAQMPLSGEAVEYIRADVRRSTIGNYVIYYQPLRDGIQVVRILHGSQRHEDLL